MVLSVNFVTSRPEKFKPQHEVLSQAFNITYVDRALRDIQGTPEIVAANRARLAADHFRVPCVVEATSFSVKSLLDLPGPVTGLVLDLHGVDGLWSIVANLPDKSAFYTSVLAFSYPGNNPIVFKVSVAGTAVEPRTPTLEAMFQIDGHDKPLSEQPAAFHPRHLSCSSFLSFLGDDESTWDLRKYVPMLHAPPLAFSPYCAVHRPIGQDIKRNILGEDGYCTGIHACAKDDGTVAVEFE